MIRILTLYSIELKRDKCVQMEHAHVMHDEIGYHLWIDYTSQDNLDIEETRRFFVDLVEELLKRLNNDRILTAYTGGFVFTPLTLFISVDFDDGQGATAMSASGETPDLKPDLQSFSGLLVLVGAGKMGGALLEGWLRSGLDPKKVAVIEPQPAPEIAALSGRGVRLNPTSPGQATAVVLAVKPQVAAQVLPTLRPLLAPSSLVVSIMAGRTLEFIATALQSPGALVRAMPNTPAAIGRGITVAVPERASPAQCQLAHALLAATGTVEWIDDETLMDAVTAVSGSGPAYIFLLVEALAQAGIAAGLPAPLAAKLARETVAGAGELLHRSPLDAATLRENVTSPGGTTAAALAVLMGDNGLAPLMNRAIAAATARSRQLAG